MRCHGRKHCSCHQRGVRGWRSSGVFRAYRCCRSRGCLRCRRPRRPFYRNACSNGWSTAGNCQREQPATERKRCPTAHAKLNQQLTALLRRAAQPQSAAHSLKVAAQPQIELKKSSAARLRLIGIALHKRGSAGAFRTQLMVLRFQPVLLQLKPAELQEERIDTLKCGSDLRAQFISVQNC